MFIGIISDTHGVFDDRVKAFLEPVDQIWHAGDWGGPVSFADSITAWKPTVGVYGNCDGQDFRLTFPEYQLFDCEGVKVLMTHIGGYPGRYDPKARHLIDTYRPGLFVCGHSHILKVMFDHKHEMLCINPGACGNQGWHVEKTALRVRIDEGNIHDMELFRLPRDTKFKD